MADLCLTLPIFISSPNEVRAERDAAEAEILELVRDAASEELFLDPFRWEKHHFPHSEYPNAPLLDKLRRSELVVVILWTQLGDGTREELDEALRLSQLGQIDNVFIYFKMEPRAGLANSPAQLRRLALNDAKRALTWAFQSTADFRAEFGQHLRTWLHRWRGVTACCKFALENSTTIKGTQHKGENRLHGLEQVIDLDSLERVKAHLGGEAVKGYQRFGPDAIRQPLSRTVLQQLDTNWHSLVLQPGNPGDGYDPFAGQGQLGRVVVNPKPLLYDSIGEVHFADLEWFYYFCAVGLAAAILDGQVRATALRPYINPIHQYLSAHVRREHIDIATTLRRWLRNADGLTAGLPVVRNFAAYVLGMIGAFEAQDDLAWALRHDDGQDVDTYCITSLTKLRARRQLPVLVEMFQKERNERKRMLLSQAVCTIAGVAHYEM